MSCEGTQELGQGIGDDPRSPLLGTSEKCSLQQLNSQPWCLPTTPCCAHLLQASVGENGLSTHWRSYALENPFSYAQEPYLCFTGEGSRALGGRGGGDSMIKVTPEFVGTARRKPQAGLQIERSLFPEARL